MAILDPAALAAMSYDELLQFTMDNDMSNADWDVVIPLLHEKAPSPPMSEEELDAAWERFVVACVPPDQQDAFRAAAARNKELRAQGLL